MYLNIYIILTFKCETDNFILDFFVGESVILVWGNWLKLDPYLIKKYVVGS